MPKRKIRAVRADSLKVGHVFMETPGMPARIYGLAITNRAVHIVARYEWTPITDPTWRVNYLHYETVLRVL